MFIRPLLPEVLYRGIDVNTLPKDSIQLPRYLPNNSQAVLVEASHPRPAPSPSKKFKIPLIRKAMPAVQLINKALSLPHPIPVMGELVIEWYKIVGDWIYIRAKLWACHEGRIIRTLFSSTRVHLLLYLLTLLVSIYLAEFHPFNAGFY